MALLRCLSLPSSIPMHWFALLCCTHLLLCTLFLLGVMLVLCIVHLSHVACALYGSTFPVLCMHCILWFVLYSFPCACPLPFCAWGCIPAWSPIRLAAMHGSQAPHTLPYALLAPVLSPAAFLFHFMSMLCCWTARCLPAPHPWPQLLGCGVTWPGAFDCPFWYVLIVVGRILCPCSVVCCVSWTPLMLLCLCASNFFPLGSLLFPSFWVPHLRCLMWLSLLSSLLSLSGTFTSPSSWLAPAGVLLSRSAFIIPCLMDWCHPPCFLGAHLPPCCGIALCARYCQAVSFPLLGLHAVSLSCVRSGILYLPCQWSACCPFPSSACQ